MLDCIITSDKETKHYTEVKSVTLPAVDGQMQILKNHAESFTLLRQGNIIIRLVNGREEKIQTENGACHTITNNVIIVL